MVTWVFVTREVPLFGDMQCIRCCVLNQMCPVCFATAGKKLMHSSAATKLYIPISRVENIPHLNRYNIASPWPSITTSDSTALR